MKNTTGVHVHMYRAYNMLASILNVESPTGGGMKIQSVVHADF